MKALPTLLLSLAVAVPGRAATAPAGITATGAYVAAAPPGVTTLAAYLTLTNTTPAPVTLTGARTNAAPMTMLMQDARDAAGRRTMKNVTRLTISAGGSLRLTPGHGHLMLMDARPLKAGQTVNLVLSYASGATQTLTLPVRKSP
jgi:periplasmic copper chaperone A